MAKRVLWILMLLGFLMALAGIFMRTSVNPAIYGKAPTIGWIGIAIALIARILLGIKRRTERQTKKPL